MATTTIPWGDGSGDNIYLTYSSASGDQTVDVSSDANTGAARSKVVTFSSIVGSITQQLTISQAAGNITPVFYEYLYFDGTAYINTNYYLPKLCTISVGLGHESQKVAQGVFMASGSTAYIAFKLGTETTSSNRRINVYYGSKSNLSGSRNLSFSYATYNFFLTPKRYGWGSTSYNMSKGSGHPTNALQIGVYDSVQPYTGRMKMLRVYGSDAQNVTKYSELNSYTPLATFRPCTYNGEAGFWYVEGNRFFGNSAGSGTITASDS